MNKPIARVFAVIVAMFALLIAFTSRWTVFEASALRHVPLNRRPALLRERIPRGSILARNGAVLARSIRGNEGTYERTYPFGALFAAPVGYSFTEAGQTGLELYRNEVLEGHRETNLESLFDELQGKEPEGDNVVTTLDVHAQQVAAEALNGYRGSVVAIEPATGAVRVMLTVPSFDPNQMSTRAGRERLEHQSKQGQLLDRAVQYGFAPGSTFKIVTASAAFNSGQFTPNSMLSGRNGIAISGVPLHNDNNESFGEVTLTKALALSINTVWAQVAVHLGRQLMETYMNRFGFDHKPRIELPADEMTASGEYEGGRLLRPIEPEVDVGRMGIGQDKLVVTPLQMAEVAATIADGGKLMRPRLTERITDSEGRTLRSEAPQLQSTVISPSSAEAVRGTMEAVVKEGTGIPAQIPGVRVAGKTGTAETQFGSAINDAWFIAFAPAQAPKVAVAVAVEKVPGYGATYAAPVAKRVMEALLG